MILYEWIKNRRAGALAALGKAQVRLVTYIYLYIYMFIMQTFTHMCPSIMVCKAVTVLPRAARLRGGRYGSMYKMCTYCMVYSDGAANGGAGAGRYVVCAFVFVCTYIEVEALLCTYMQALLCTYMHSYTHHMMYRVTVLRRAALVRGVVHGYMKILHII
mmetsp:Transcript_70113/g.186808  ORF Transcript_70113/g.186808 Transcript_70113/m.186808 type:complete len:160 (-) Transcript_70113:610-1089(-)